MSLSLRSCLSSHCQPFECQFVGPFLSAVVQGGLACKLGTLVSFGLSSRCFANIELFCGIPGTSSTFFTDVLCASCRQSGNTLLRKKSAGGTGHLSRRQTRRQSPRQKLLQRKRNHLLKRKMSHPWRSERRLPSHTSLSFGPEKAETVAPSDNFETLPKLYTSRSPAVQTSVTFCYKYGLAQALNTSVLNRILWIGFTAVDAYCADCWVGDSFSHCAVERSVKFGAGLDLGSCRQQSQASE